jgi:outer membrane protein assembly factor BamB
MRRTIGAAIGVGLLSTLGLPWVHDESGRAGVVQIFDVGRGASTDRAWPLLALFLVVAAAVASLRTVLRPGIRLLPQRITVATPPPPSPGRLAVRAALTCLAAAGASAGVTTRLEGRADVALPTSAVVAGVGAVMWTLLAWRHLRDAGGRRMPGPKAELTAIGVVVAVTVLTAAVGAPWWVEGRHVDATTTGRQGSGPSTGPTNVDQVEWSASVDDVLAAGAHFVLHGADGDRGDVSVVDAATGDELWHYHHDQPLDVAVSEQAGLVIVHQALDEGLTELVGLDLSSGRERWSRRQSGLVTPGLMARHGLTTVFGEVGDLLLAHQFGGRLLALDPASGRRLWSIDSPLDECPELWRLTGDVLVGLSECHLGDGVVAVDRDTGRTLWELDGELFLPTVTTVDGVVVVREYAVMSVDSSSSYVFVGLDARSGRELWRREGRSWPAAPVVTGGRIVTAFDSGRGEGPWELQGLVPRTGEIAWSQDLSTVIPVRGNGDDGLTVGTDGTRTYITAITDDQAVVATFGTEGRTLGTRTFPLCEDEQPCSEGLPVAPQMPPRPDATSSVTTLLPGGGVLVVAAGTPLFGGTGTQVHGPIVAVGPRATGT